MTEKIELTTNYRFWTAIINLFAPGAGKRRLHTKLEVLSAGYKAERDKHLELSTFLEDLQESASALVADNVRLTNENKALRAQLETARYGGQKRFIGSTETRVTETPATPPAAVADEEPVSEQTHTRISLSALQGSTGVIPLHARGASISIPKQASSPD